MIIKVPQSSEYQRVLIEISGQDVLRRIEASTEVSEVTPFLPEGVDENNLCVTAQFLNEAHEPKGEAIVLKEPKIVESPEIEVPKAEYDLDDEADEVT